jgi:hypothetical protein
MRPHPYGHSTVSLLKFNPKDFNTLVMEKEYLDVINLIRSIQKAEGRTNCFARNPETCEQTDCTWRSYCLDMTPGSNKPGQPAKKKEDR